MSQVSNHAEGFGDSKSLFQVTRWSLILAIGRGDTVHATSAREEFCRTYWHAVYGFIRRRGRSEADAQDLTQDFFVSHLLIRNAFRQLNPDKGKFRSFLMTALRNFLANQYDIDNAKKRRPVKPFVPLEEAEHKYLVGAKAGWTEEMVFDRQWAVAIAFRAMTRLRERWVAKGQGELFEALKTFLTNDPIDGEYDKLGARFHMQNKAVAMAVSRLRKMRTALLREVLLQTLRNEKDLEEEWRYLIEVLSR
jgi:RNA polymerase sigma-70 factor (ECF subfamily)